jgi:peptidyl-dipeptidase A
MLPILPAAPRLTYDPLMTARLAAAAVVLALLVVPACRRSDSPAAGSGGDQNVTQFLAEANAKLLDLSNAANEAGWVQDNFITVDTQAISARATEAFVNAATDYAKRAAKFPATAGTADEQRQLQVLKNTMTMAAPNDPKKTTELATITARMSAAYGSGKYCPPGAEGNENCLDVEAVTKILAENRDPKRLREVWEGWHTIGAPMKQDYVRFVELSNEGAKEVGFPDTGAMWRSRYDMQPEAFAKELDRLWEQLRPLYLSLHAHVRARLHDKYGDEVPAEGPIPAHLLGNIWAQEWNNIYDIVAPGGGTARAVPLDDILKQRKTQPIEMARIAERFFTSVGFDPLPKTFWERSLFTKPRDREVVCHASAWDINNVDDVRIKMCIDPTEEDFTTIHHELGHNFYQRAYAGLPIILRDSANDGFHEAIGDTIALSVTPEYLVKIGIINKTPDASGDIPLLMGRALDKLAFLPFGLVIDQWRWNVFNGTVKPDRYNAAWWELREKYQGVRAPSVRGEEFFDPGAKYHVPSNTPYARYFLAAVLQFQFHRALAKAAGCETPLHRCSIYGNKEAGERLKKALAMGASRPWPDVLEVLTGQREMDATAIADYFAPLKTWLDEQNKGRKLGW